MFPKLTFSNLNIFKTEKVLHFLVKYLAITNTFHINQKLSLCDRQEYKYLETQALLLKVYSATKKDYNTLKLVIKTMTVTQK